MLEVFMILITQSPDGELSGAFAVQQGREACNRNCYAALASLGS